MLQVEQLSVGFRSKQHIVSVVSNVSFTINAGQTVALVGESGSGKSVTALAIMQLLSSSQAVYDEASLIAFAGKNLLGNPKTIAALRGKELAMIFQEPMTSLNPLHSIGKQIGEAIRLHQGLKNHAVKAEIIHLLKQVELDRLTDRLDAFPHELSGGQRQRIMIAMALAGKPKLLIADEPTTALDVTVQAKILSLLVRLKEELNMGLLLITHDLPLVQRYADHVYVMQEGRIVEEGITEQIFTNPQHTYTQLLIGSKPERMIDSNDIANSGVICEADNLSVAYPLDSGWFGMNKTYMNAVDNANFTVHKGTTLGIVGESGSGKTTLAHAILRLIQSTGKIQFGKETLNALSGSDLRHLRQKIQLVFQDPYASLNPRMTIFQIINEGLLAHYPAITHNESLQKISNVLTDVELDPDIMDRYPHEFSGGQRQRIAIARALILQPELIILDEPTSALDQTVQKKLLSLLIKLQQQKQLTYIFITHDLQVVYAVSHEVIVMEQGKIVEKGKTEVIFKHPTHPYTQRLFEAALASEQ